MRCNNCSYKLNKTWKLCPNCGNKIENENLPFKAKKKEWIDKHLLSVNVFYCLPVNFVYTLLPAYLVYWAANKIGMTSGSNDMMTSMLYMLGYSVLLPILLMIFFIIFLKSYVKSFKLARYAVNVSGDGRYNYFIIGNIVGLLLACVVCLFLLR